MIRYIVTYLAEETQHDTARNESWTAEVKKTQVFTEEGLMFLRKRPNTYYPILKVEKIEKTTLIDNDEFLESLKDRREAEQILEKSTATQKEIAQLKARLKQLVHNS